MEEKKSKNIEMKVSENNQQKLTYDELNQVCAELSQQNQQMQNYIKRQNQQLQQLAEENMMKRLDYLFTVLKYSNMFDSDFVKDCAQEIKESLTIHEEAEHKPE